MALSVQPLNELVQGLEVLPRLFDQASTDRVSRKWNVEIEAVRFDPRKDFAQRLRGRVGLRLAAVEAIRKLEQGLSDRI